MHKSEVLGVLIYLGACNQAIRWIEEHPSDSAETVYNDCTDIDYLRWLTGALNINTLSIKPPWETVRLAVYKYPVWR